MCEGVLWTNLSLGQLSRRLLALGTPASRRTIRRPLRELKLDGGRPGRKRRWGTTPIAMRNLKILRRLPVSMRRLAMR